jgi:translation initiation factor IF-1
MTDGNPPENKQDSGRPPGGRNNRVAASNFDDGQTLEGTVREIFPRSIFKVELDNGTEILAHISGKIRKNFVKKIEPGDRVLLTLTPHDLTRGRITKFI